jgi:hypothetical protein
MRNEILLHVGIWIKVLLAQLLYYAISMCRLYIAAIFKSDLLCQCSANQQLYLWLNCRFNSAQSYAATIQSRNPVELNSLKDCPAGRVGQLAKSANLMNWTVC